MATMAPWSQVSDRIMNNNFAYDVISPDLYTNDVIITRFFSYDVIVMNYLSNDVIIIFFLVQSRKRIIGK